MPEALKTDEGIYKPTAEIGRRSLKQFGGYIHEEFDPDLRGIRGVRTFDEMRRNDPTIAMGLKLISWFLGRVRWTVPPISDNPADVEAALFLDSCRDDMSGTWSKFLRDALTCLVFGWSYLEWTLKQRNGPDGDPASRFDDGRFGWRKINLIGQETLLRWEFAEDGGIKGMWQLSIYSPPPNLILVPIEKCVLFRTDDEKNNPEGISLLRAVYRPYYIKKQIEEIEAIGIERDLTGVLIIHLPVSATETDFTKARDLVEQFKADDMAGFVAPTFGAGEHEQWRFEIINSPGNKTIDTDKIIQRYQLEIARVFLAQFLMLGQMQGSGSRALSKDHSEVFTVAVESILHTIEETINRYLVPPLFRFNSFGTLTAIPKIKAGRVSKGDIGTLADALQKLGSAGYITPGTDVETYLRQELQLPEMKQEPGQAPTEETGQGAKSEKRQATEPDDGLELIEFDLPDPDSSEWDNLEKKADEILRKGGKRSAGELLQFARAYDYAGTLEKQQAAFRNEMRDIAGRLREGTISFGQWQQLSQTAIVGNTIAGYKLGVAQATSVTPAKVKLTSEQRAGANQAVESQLKYFADFARTVRDQLKGGKELTTAIDARANLYGGSMRSALNQAKIDKAPEQSFRWVRSKLDSCETCLAMEGQVKTASEWDKGGILPSAGTECNGHCGCSLESV